MGGEPPETPATRHLLAGREQQVESLRRHLSDPTQRRLVIVSGPPGVGKTAVAESTGPDIFFRVRGEHAESTLRELIVQALDRDGSATNGWWAQASRYRRALRRLDRDHQ